MSCDPWAVLLVLHEIPPHIEKKKKKKNKGLGRFPAGYAMAPGTWCDL